MTLSSQYEAAIEIREAIHTLASEVGDQLAQLRGVLAAGRGRRREQWAGELFAELVALTTRAGVKTFGVGAEDGRKLAATVWELVDILDAADPQGKAAAAAADEPAAGELS